MIHTENNRNLSENMLNLPAEDELKKEIEDLEQRLTAKKRQLEEARGIFSKQTDDSAASLKYQPDNLPHISPSEINKYSSSKVKIVLFRSLFKGREDVYARRFESKKTGKSGYQPACRNEWVKGICEKPKTNCGNCSKRSFEPVTNEVIRNHIEGFSPAKSEWEKPVPFVVGIYPLLQNETCYFLAVDFDKEAWREDAKAFIETCKLEGIPAVLERSRSGNGAHVWIFFAKQVPSVKARRLGTFLMTRTLDRRPEIGLDSFDRFFPSQDTLPKGGFGNLIALPLQKAAR